MAIIMSHHFGQVLSQWWWNWGISTFGWFGSPDKDLCDRLLERGVLVYDSARELLAIDVRQRKEQLAPEVSWSGRAWENHDLGGPQMVVKKVMEMGPLISREI